jgi:hypothetical protein
VRVRNILDVRGTSLAASIAAALGLASAASAQTLQGLGMAERPLLGSGVVVYEQQWAATLVRALALDEVLPEDPDDADVFALLCADAAEMATDSEGRRAPTRAAFRISREMTEARAPAEPLRVVLDVPATALYLLAVEGTGKQRWTVDQRPVGHLDASDLGAAFGPRVLPLRDGPHELAGYMGTRARVDRVELTAYRPLCIAPAGGWRSGRPLSYGAQARTLVRALGLDRYLPAARTTLSLEGERFSSASRWGGRSNGAPDAGDAGGRIDWARTGDSPAEFSYRIRLPKPGVYSLEARLRSATQQHWSIDGRYRARVEAPTGDGGFSWAHVMTTSLTAGEHVLRAVVPPGSGIDRIRMIERQAGDPDYVEVVAQMGFAMGATRSLVTRSASFAALSHPAFQELAEGFLERLAGGASELPLVALDDDPAPLYSRPLVPVLPAEL